MARPGPDSQVGTTGNRCIHSLSGQVGETRRLFWEAAAWGGRHGVSCGLAGEGRGVRVGEGPGVPAPAQSSASATPALVLAGRPAPRHRQHLQAAAGVRGTGAGARAASSSFLSTALPTATLRLPASWEDHEVGIWLLTWIPDQLAFLSRTVHFWKHSPCRIAAGAPQRSCGAAPWTVVWFIQGVGPWPMQLSGGAHPIQCRLGMQPDEAGACPGGFAICGGDGHLSAGKANRREPRKAAWGRAVLQQALRSR